MDPNISKGLVKQLIKLNIESNNAESHESGKQLYENLHPEKHILSVINTMKSNNILCDVVLQTDNGCDLPAHKMILAAFSPYFHNLFTKSKGRDEKCIRIKGVDHSIVKSLIDYIYTARIGIDLNKLREFLTASSLFGLIEIYDLCFDLLNSHLSSINCLGIRHFAETHGYSKLMSEIDIFIEDNFPYIVERDEFRNLASHQLEKIISSDNLRAISEEVVFESVLAWINVDPENRKKSTAQLIKHVRLPFLSKEYLTEFVEKNPMIQVNSQCREFVKDALDYQLMGETDEYNKLHEMSSRNRQRKPRNLEKVLLVVGGFKNESRCHVEYLDFGEKKWYKMPNSPMKKCCSKLVIVKERVYSVGGSIQFGPSRSVNIYDVTADEWLPRGDMNIARMAHGVAVLNNHIYAVGGVDDKGNFLNSVEVYNPKTNQWKMIAPMNYPRANIGVGVFQGHLYAAGGTNGIRVFDIIEHYKNNKWQLLAPMVRPKHGVGVKVLDGRLHVFGGQDWRGFAKCDFDGLNLGTKKWTSRTVMPFPFSRPEVVELNSKSYIIGSNEMEMDSPIAVTYSMRHSFTFFPGKIQNDWTCFGIALIDKPRTTTRTIMKQNTRLFENNDD